MPRIRHLAIVTSNRPRLVQFYSKAFGMRVIYNRPGRTYLSDGHFNLAIADKSGDMKEGLTIMGFDVEDIKDLSERLTSAGATGLSPIPKDHDAEYRALDPDGNCLDLSIHGWSVG